MENNNNNNNNAFELCKDWKVRKGSMAAGMFVCTLLPIQKHYRLTRHIQPTRQFFEMIIQLLDDLQSNLVSNCPDLNKKKHVYVSVT